eukprot:g2258.t1
MARLSPSEPGHGSQDQQRLDALFHIESRGQTIEDLRRVNENRNKELHELRRDSHGRRHVHEQEADDLRRVNELHWDRIGDVCLRSDSSPMPPSVHKMGNPLSKKARPVAVVPLSGDGTAAASSKSMKKTATPATAVPMKPVPDLTEDLGSCLICAEPKKRGYCGSTENASLAQFVAEELRRMGFVVGVVSRDPIARESELTSGNTAHDRAPPGR